MKKYKEFVNEAGLATNAIDLKTRQEEIRNEIESDVTVKPIDKDVIAKNKADIDNINKTKETIDKNLKDTELKRNKVETDMKIHQDLETGDYTPDTKKKLQKSIEDTKKDVDNLDKQIKLNKELSDLKKAESDAKLKKEQQKK